jgi:hypothetical protein
MSDDGKVCSEARRKVHVDTVVLSGHKTSPTTAWRIVLTILAIRQSYAISKYITIFIMSVQINLLASIAKVDGSSCGTRGTGSVQVRFGQSTEVKEDGGLANTVNFVGASPDSSVERSK